MQKKLGLDSITDFNRAEDVIFLNRTCFSKVKFTADGHLQRKEFAVVRNSKQAKQSSATLTYVQSAGVLYYNENRAKPGFGTGGQFVDLVNGLPLSASSIRSFR